MGVQPDPAAGGAQRAGGGWFRQPVPQHGARFAAVSPEDARQVYELRILLEPMAMEDCLAHSDEAYRAGVSRAFDAFLLVAGTGRAPGLIQFEAHRAFHEATYARCSSDWLRRIIGLLSDSSARYTSMLGEHDEALEHRRIRDAILVGDTAAAVTALTAHLQARLDWARHELAVQESG